MKVRDVSIALIFFMLGVWIGMNINILNDVDVYQSMQEWYK